MTHGLSLCHLGCLFGVDELDHVVDSQDGNGGFRCELKGLDLGHSRLKHTRLQVVARLSVHQVETREDQIALLRVLRGGLLGSVVEDAELSDQVCRVLGSV